MAIDVTYGHGTTTLLTENVSIQPGDPFDVSIDLNKNLRSRNKTENTYVDAKDLSGQMDSLGSIRASDRQFSNAVPRVFDQVKTPDSRSAERSLRIVARR